MQNDNGELDIFVSFKISWVDDYLSWASLNLSNYGYSNDTINKTRNISMPAALIWVKQSHFY